MNTVNLEAIYVMWLRHVKRFIRARSRIIANIAQPLIFLIALGFGFSSVRFPGMPSDIGYMDFLAPGIVMMSVLFSSIFAGVSVIWDREFGFLQEVFVAPVRRITIVIGRVLGGSTTALMQGGIIIVISYFLGVKIIQPGLALAILFMVLISFSAVSFGLVIASRMTDIHGFQLIMNLLIMPLIFFSPVFYPLSGVPDWLRRLVLFNPLTYGVDGLRRSLVNLGYIPLEVDLAVLLGVCVVLMFVASYIFSKSEV